MPAAPRSTAKRESSIVSGSAVQPVPGRSRIPAGCAASRSITALRSSSESDGPSPVVPSGEIVRTPRSASQATCSSSSSKSTAAPPSVKGVSSAGIVPSTG